MAISRMWVRGWSAGSSRRHLSPAVPPRRRAVPGAATTCIVRGIGNHQQPRGVRSVGDLANVACSISNRGHGDLRSDCLGGSRHQRAAGAIGECHGLSSTSHQEHQALVLSFCLDGNTDLSHISLKADQSETDLVRPAATLQIIDVDSAAVAATPDRRLATSGTRGRGRSRSTCSVTANIF